MPPEHITETTTFLQRLTDLPAGFWGVLSEMAPYLLFGFFMAGLLSVFIGQKLVERHLGGRGIWPVLKAAILGVPLPLCSCGVIPVSASLHRHGASNGATTAFLISTPQTGVDSIFVTYSMLGWVFAIFRPIAAFISGVIGGFLVDITHRDQPRGPAGQTTICEDACCKPAKHNKLYSMFSYGFGTLPRDIGKSLLIGLVIAALISALMPENFFAPYLGGGILAMFVMMLVGIPVYVCATASVPVAAMLVMHAGVSPGAAFAFLVTGPATNAATIAMIWKVMGRRTTLVYLLTIAGTAMAGGLTLDYILKARDMAMGTPDMTMLPPWVNTASAVALLCVLGFAIIRPYLGRARSGHATAVLYGEQGGAQTITLLVGGMTCGHCTESVENAIRQTSGVEVVSVNLKTGEAVAVGRSMSAEQIIQAVVSAGYEAKIADEASRK